MASKGIDVGTDVVNLQALFNLEADKPYGIQNKSDYRLYLWTGAAAPDPDDPAVDRAAKFIPPNNSGTIEYTDGEPIFAWYRGSGYGQVAIA